MATRPMPHVAMAVAAAAAAEKSVDEQAADQAVAGKRAVVGKAQRHLDSSPEIEVEVEVDSEASAPEMEDAVQSEHPEVLIDRAQFLVD